MIPCRMILTLFLLTVALLQADQRNITINTDLDSTNSEKATKLGSIVVQSNSSATISSCKNFFSPTEFDKPEMIRGKDGSVTCIPIFPKQFQQSNLGWKLTYKVSEQNGIIVLVGTAVYSEASLANAVYGEFSGPIYETVKGKKVKMSENIARSGALDTSTTHFQLFAKPGKSYTVQLKKINVWVPATITCDFPDSNIIHERGTKVSLTK